MFAAFILIVLALIGVWLYQGFFGKPISPTRCSRCEGKGYWLGTRDREQCDWCKGTGELSNED